MLRVVESQDRLEIVSPMPLLKRLLFLLLALVPLLAPYELLVAPGWESILNPFFGFAALISFGALAVSGFLAWAAIAGIEPTARFDRQRRTLTTVARAPVMPLQARTYSLDDLRAIEVETTEWSDGGPSYSLKIDTADGRAFKLLAEYDKAETEEVRRQISRFLSQPSGLGPAA
jgi:hypothetical protein